ncbi:MAG: hypothetical protein ACI8PZ_003831 [Myxococcota bacterium]|jgi:hypothetical protein
MDRRRRERGPRCLAKHTRPGQAERVVELGLCENHPLNTITVYERGERVRHWAEWGEAEGRHPVDDGLHPTGIHPVEHVSAVLERVTGLGYNHSALFELPVARFLG